VKLRASLAALLTLSSPGVAVAGDAGRVALLLPSCELPGVSAQELRHAVALDLQAEGLVLAPAGELSPARDVQVLVEAACPAPDELTLRAERGSEQQLRSLRLSELSLEQRARALSLALSELVSLVLNPPPPRSATPTPTPTSAFPAEEAPGSPLPAPTAEPPPAPVAPPKPALVAPVDRPPADTRARPRWRLGFAPLLRLFDGTSLWGAQVQLSRARFRYGAGLLMARTESSPGSVWTRLAHATVGYAFPLLGEAQRATLESGPRLGFGYTFLNAEGRAGVVAYDARDWYLDAAWTARYETALSGSLRLGLGAELGYGRGPIGYADDVPIARTSGVFASVTLDGSMPL
jgi:hypothetical protein